MSALYRADSPSTTHRSSPDGPVAEPLDGAGIYLTNEAFLYRVVGFVASAPDDMVELEDCYGLDVVTVPLADMCARGLRVVTPIPVDV